MRGCICEFSPTPDGYEIPVRNASIRDLEGVVSPLKEPVMLEEMDDAIARWRYVTSPWVLCRDAHNHTPLGGPQRASTTQINQSFPRYAEGAKRPG